MRKALLDTSTYLDILRSPKNRRRQWARNTAAALLTYRAEYPRLTVSSYTILEILEGFYRDGNSSGAEEFFTNLLPAFEVIYADSEVIKLGAEINARLASVRQSIGLVDVLIAASAIRHGMAVVTANVRHFQRVKDAGFSLELVNWREYLP